jgi:diguanylate cyclase (GGDEF)-like protein
MPRLRLRLPLRLLRRTVTNERELRAFVVRITALCVVVAVGVEVVNQLLFFVSWSAGLREEAISAAVAFALAVPISLVIGRTQLELYRAKCAVDELSRTDVLTGLPNRRAFMEALETASDDPAALVIVDIDRFKHVNDTHGHPAGDTVISAVGQMIAAELGQFAKLGRIGGEEFAALACGNCIRDLPQKLSALRDRVAATPIVSGGNIVRVTVSAGVALRGAGESSARFYAEADRALYAAKSAGRNRIRFAASFKARYDMADEDAPSPRSGAA